MAEYDITHIIPDRLDPGYCIDAIYGPVCGLLYLDEAITWIANGNVFYTRPIFGPRARIWFIPATVFRRAHLSTSPDGIGANNLLSLPHYA
jgi:hypothetical protein